MKLLIVAVLLLLANACSAGFIVNCTFTPEEIEDMEFYTNRKRKLFADRYQVMNMNQLKYDPSLAKHASDFNSCDDLKRPGGANYRIEGSSNKDAYEAVKKFVKYFSNVGMPSWVHEDIHPGQTSFAKCRISEVCPQTSIGENEEGVRTFEWELISIIFYGPRSRFAHYDLESGPPGYGCRNEHKDGLCQPKGTL